MRRWAIAFVFLLLVACGTEPIITYVVTWNTSEPIDPDTMTIEVAGGTLYGSSMNRLHTIGSIEVVAPIECVSVVWHADTKQGTAQGFYFWDSACTKLYFPLIRYD